MYSPYTNRALKVANRLFNSNRDLAEVAAIDWKLTVIDADIVNAGILSLFLISKVLKLVRISFYY